MTTFNFKLTTGDMNAGTVYLPSEDISNAPVIIYCHGWGGKRQLWTPTQMLCDKAMNEGVALVTFDFFGCGETGGDYSKMTYTRWKNNLSEVVSWVAAQSFSNRSKIGCYSFSSGTTVALRLAAEDERLSFIISVGTCISTHISMGSGGPAKLLADNLSRLLSGGTAKLFGIDFGIDFFVDTISNAPIHSLDKIVCPVLFLQGTADNPFRCADAKMGYDIITYDNRHSKSKYISFEGGTHELDNVAGEAINTVFAWLMPILKQ